MRKFLLVRWGGGIKKSFMMKENEKKLQTLKVKLFFCSIFSATSMSIE